MFRRSRRWVEDSVAAAAAGEPQPPEQSFQPVLRAAVQPDDSADDSERFAILRCCWHSAAFVWHLNICLSVHTFVCVSCQSWVKRCLRIDLHNYLNTLPNKTASRAVGPFALQLNIGGFLAPGRFISVNRCLTTYTKAICKKVSAPAAGHGRPSASGRQRAPQRRHPRSGLQGSSRRRPPRCRRLAMQHSSRHFCRHIEIYRFCRAWPSNRPCKVLAYAHG